MSKKTLMAFVGGVVVTLAGVAAVDAQSYVSSMPAASSSARHLTIEPMPAPEAKILSGTPEFSGTAYTVTPDKKVLSGVWAAKGPSTFEWTYGIDEAVYIIEGGCELEYQGQKFALKPGDTVFFQAGTKAMWTVPAYVRKTWTIYKPNSLTRMYRKLVAPPVVSG